jgi:hypothetical protein
LTEMLSSPGCEGGAAFSDTISNASWTKNAYAYAAVSIATAYGMGAMDSPPLDL